MIVPCGKAKIWARNPQAGPTAAADTYVGAPFTVNRRYAERAGGDWVILSAEHGFLQPADVVPGPYETTRSSRQSTNPIGPEALREQVEQLGLDHYGEVIGLGGKEYLRSHRGSLRRHPGAAQFPFAGLPIGKRDGCHQVGHPINGR